MNAKPCRLAATAFAFCMGVCIPAFGQMTTDNPASTPIGRGAGDGSRPADGAIKGGSILPGESAGMPDERAKSRCGDLQGTLREQCLERERGASIGGTRLPEPDIAKPPPTREAPPPQNPPPLRN